jgi:uncharacterized membrane protein YedE/YeeE
MKANLAAGTVGFLFALGLGISGMTDPQKVLSFLDIFGKWDPSLAFVMIGAILVHLPLYRLIRRQMSPRLCSEWHIPENSKITPSLMMGAMIFGMGWGLAGYCPGPAITSLATLNFRPLIFVATMILGMFLFKVLDRKIGFKR